MTRDKATAIAAINTEFQHGRIRLGMSSEHLAAEMEAYGRQLEPATITELIEQFLQAAVVASRFPESPTELPL